MWQSIACSVLGTEKILITYLFLRDAGWRRTGDSMRWLRSRELKRQDTLGSFTASCAVFRSQGLPPWG